MPIGLEGIIKGESVMASDDKEWFFKKFNPGGANQAFSMLTAYKRPVHMAGLPHSMKWPLCFWLAESTRQHRCKWIQAQSILIQVLIDLITMNWPSYHSYRY